MSSHVRTDRRDRAAWITLDRPERKNAFIGTMREELADAIERAGSDSEVRVIVITGAGGSFCSGGDLDRLAEISSSRDSEALRLLLAAGARVVRAIRKIPKPVVAIVEGAAAGAGCSLAAACDLVIAGSSAKFSLAFVKIGFVPDWGATHLLPRRIGHARAYRMGATAESIDAETALAWGLADRVFPDAELAGAATRELAALASLSPTSLSFQKFLIGSEELPALDDALARETEAQLACFETEEFRKFLADRKR